MKKRKALTLILGILIIIITFIFKFNWIARILMSFVGILLLETHLYLKKRRLLTLFFFPIIIFCCLYLIDTALAFEFNFKPVYAREIKSSDSFITTNSLIYRIYNCGDIKYYDFLYKKSDVCSYSNLDEKEINSLSSEIVNSHKKYKDKFYILSGKVSYKEGNDIIELKAYSVSEESINGNVNFLDNITFKIKLSNTKNIDKIKVFDNIKIVGRIDKIKSDKNNYNIFVKEAYIIEEDLYSNFEINIVNNKSCQIDKTKYIETDKNNYYTNCVKELFVIYDNEEVYELSYALKDNKLELENLIKSYKKSEITETEDIIYYLENYNIIVCNDNNDVIIGNTSLEFDKNYCGVKDNDINEL